MKVRIIREDKIETKVINTKAKNIEELMKDLEINLDNFVIIKNGKVITDFSEKIREGDTIKIIEAVGGG